MISIDYKGEKIDIGKKQWNRSKENLKLWNINPSCYAVFLLNVKYIYNIL